jgi:transposase-like protein
MSLINHKELKRQIQSGEFRSLDNITDEFKNILREVIQTASEEELSSHLGCQKHQSSSRNNNNKPNYRNGHNKKTLKSKYGNIAVAIPRDR